jgi:PIN domain nuclease of toxin-antitoxin system
MRVLLDTHTAAWAIGDEKLLGKQARALLQTPETIIYCSAVNIFEMSLKFHAGKWSEIKPIVDDPDTAMQTLGAIQLPIYSSHARLAGAFPSSHKDPFDRLIAAQAILEQLTLLSADPMMDGFGVQRIWD